jgi:hypothetical protein
MPVIQQMSLGDELWIDLQDSATLTGVPYDGIVDAVTARHLPTITTCPQRPGDWLVRRGAVLRWAAAGRGACTWCADGLARG